MDTGLDELERMAQAVGAADALESDKFPTEEQITRWCTLFQYTRRETLTLIRAQRSDLTRTRITDEHWELVREEREATGHDRETYEHEQQLGNVLKSQSAVIPGPDGKCMFLFKLGGLLGDVQKVKEVAGLDETPKVVQGQGEMGMTNFCIVDEQAKKKIDEWLAQAQVVNKLETAKVLHSYYRPRCRG